MIKNILIILLFGIFSVHSQSSCGISGSLKGFIIKGIKSEQGAWPWIASLHYSKNLNFFCGGTLVASNMVITAAHCIRNKQTELATKPEEIIVKLGKYDLSNVFEDGSVTVNAKEIIINPSWDVNSIKWDADIAIIILKTHIDSWVSIFPICLFNNNHDDPKTEQGTVVGWGRSSTSADHENIPNQLDVTIRTNEDCFLENPRLTPFSSNRTFCAGRDDQSGPCHGDSGSGLVTRSSTNTLYYLKGIVSASLSRNGVCDVSIDAIFTNVEKFIPWIKQIATKNRIYLPTPPKKNTKQTFCFFESWAVGREGEGSFELDDFRPELCTTAVYMFANLDGDNLKSINPYLELGDNFGRNLYRRFTGLKKTHPYLRVLLGVGGWVDGSEKYSQLAANANGRKRFAENSAEFLKKYGFDGLHFHWEYPAHRGGAPADKQNFAELLKEISKVYKPENLYLSVFLRTQRVVVVKAYDVKNIAKYADALLLMTFGLADRSTKKVTFDAPIYGKGDDTVDSRISYFINMGIPSEKIILGIPFSGSNFVTTNAGNIGDEAINDIGFPGPFLKQNAFLGYNEICKMRKEQPWTVTFDSRASQAIGKFTKDGLNHVVIFETPRSVANKVKYAFERKLGGVWAWYVDTDDFHGHCKPDLTTFADFPQATGPGRKERDNSLLRTIKEVFKKL